MSDAAPPTHPRHPTEPSVWAAAHLLGTASLVPTGSPEAAGVAALFAVGLSLRLERGERLVLRAGTAGPDQAHARLSRLAGVRADPALGAALWEGGVLAPDATPRVVFVRAGVVEHLGLRGADADVPRPVGLLSAFPHRVTLLDLGRPVSFERAEFPEWLCATEPYPPLVGRPGERPEALLAAIPSAVAALAEAWWRADAADVGASAWLALARHVGEAGAADGLLPASEPTTEPATSALALRRAAQLVGLHDDLGFMGGDGSLLRGTVADGLRVAARWLEDPVLAALATDGAAHADAIAALRPALLPSAAGAGLRTAEAERVRAWLRGTDGDDAADALAAERDARVEAVEALAGESPARVVDRLEGAAYALAQRLRAERAWVQGLADWASARSERLSAR